MTTFNATQPCRLAAHRMMPERSCQRILNQTAECKSPCLKAILTQATGMPPFPKKTKESFNWEEDERVFGAALNLCAKRKSGFTHTLTIYMRKSPCLLVETHF